MKQKNFSITRTTLETIANAIREKRGTSAPMFPFQMCNFIIAYWPSEWSGTEEEYNQLSKVYTERRYYITTLLDDEA